MAEWSGQELQSSIIPRELIEGQEILLEYLAIWGYEASVLDAKVKTSIERLDLSFNKLTLAIIANEWRNISDARVDDFKNKVVEYLLNVKPQHNNIILSDLQDTNWKNQFGLKVTDQWTFIMRTRTTGNIFDWKSIPIIEDEWN